MQLKIIHLVLNQRLLQFHIKLLIYYDGHSVIGLGYAIRNTGAILYAIGFGLLSGSNIIGYGLGSNSSGGSIIQLVSHASSATYKMDLSYVPFDNLPTCAIVF